MDIPKLKAFLLWCTIINGVLLVISFIVFMAAPDLLHLMQSEFFPMPKETFDAIYLGLLGVFKICWLFFNVVPYLALLIVARN
jgi:hypothetical protein